MNRHLAHTIPFDVLYEGLLKAIDEGHVHKKECASGLELFCYTKSCVYEKAWDTLANRVARGLVVDPAQKKIVATPFEKFFNVGEVHGTSFPSDTFETYEKLDGSLIIMFYYGGKWRCATKGSFSSNQAKWAQACIDAYVATPKDGDADLPFLRGYTYLFEAIYPNNKIVIKYDYEGLVLLAAFDEFGIEKCDEHIEFVSAESGFRRAKKSFFHHFLRLQEHVNTLSSQEEGFVIKFKNGLRLKMKGAEYRRIHALISSITPLGLWKAMYEDVDITALRQDLPEEFWTDFDTIIRLITEARDNVLSFVNKAHQKTFELSDKELGLLNEVWLGGPVKGLLFALRRGYSLLEGRNRKTIFDYIRPTRNRLEGYMPSYAMNKVYDEQE